MSLPIYLPIFRFAGVVQAELGPLELLENVN